MSSSEDEEGDSPPSLSASPSRRKPMQLPTSQDSLEDELRSPATRLRVHDRPRISHSSSSSDREPRPEPATGRKPVISARELLMNFLPSTRQRKQAASPAKDAKEAAMDAAVAAYSLVTPKKATASPTTHKEREEKKEKELSAGERIARKYELRAAVKTSPKDSPRERERVASGSIGSRPTAVRRSTDVDGHIAQTNESTSPSPVAKSKKRSFWDAQTAGVDTEQEPASKTTYVSPFSNPDGFMNMKRRQQRRQQPPEAEMSEEEMKTARDAFYDDSKSEAQEIGPRPRHIIGSAIPKIDDDADEWMSDSKEMASGG